MSLNKQNYAKNNYSSNNYQGYSNRNYKKYHHHNQQEGGGGGVGVGEGFLSKKYNKQINYDPQIKGNKENIALEEEMTNDLNSINTKSNHNSAVNRYYDDRTNANFNSMKPVAQSNRQYNNKLPKQQQNKKNYQNNNMYQQLNNNAIQQMNCNNNYGVNLNGNYVHQMGRQPFNSFYPYLNQNELINQNSNSIGSGSGSNIIYINHPNQNISNIENNRNVNNNSNNNNNTNSNSNSNIIANFGQMLYLNNSHLNQTNIPEAYQNEKKVIETSNQSTTQNTLQANSINSNSESLASIHQISPVKTKVVSNNQSSLSSVSQSPKSELNKYPHYSPINKMNTRPQVPLMNCNVNYSMFNNNIPNSNSVNRSYPLSNSPQLRYPISSNPHYYNQIKYSPNLLYDYNMQCNYNQMFIPNSSNTIDKSHFPYCNSNSNQMSYFYHNRLNQNTQVNATQSNNKKDLSLDLLNKRKEMRSVKSEKNLLSLISTNDNDNDDETGIMPETETEEKREEMLLFKKIRVKVILPNQETKYFECKLNERNINSSVAKFIADNSIDNPKMLTLLVYKITKVIATIYDILRYNLNQKEREQLLQIQKIITNKKETCVKKGDGAKENDNDLNTSSMYEFQAYEQFKSIFNENENENDLNQISLSMTQ